MEKWTEKFDNLPGSSLFNINDDKDDLGIYLNLYQPLDESF